jgi:hypothetical protein
MEFTMRVGRGSDTEAVRLAGVWLREFHEAFVSCGMDVDESWEMTALSQEGAVADTRVSVTGGSPVERARIGSFDVAYQFPGVIAGKLRLFLFPPFDSLRGVVHLEVTKEAECSRIASRGNKYRIPDDPAAAAEAIAAGWTGAKPTTALPPSMRRAMDAEQARAIRAQVEQAAELH